MVDGRGRTGCWYGGGLCSQGSDSRMKLKVSEGVGIKEKIGCIKGEQA
jgi:hypothetical protein